MSTTLDSAAAADAGSPDRKPAPRGNPVVWQILKPLASLQLTVVLFALSMALVFFGTLAQVDKGIWTVVDEYFRSWYVWVPGQLIAKFGWKFFEFPSPDTNWTWHFPLPGGWVIGGLMALNLLAAHVVRFKLSWRRAGIITLHLGVILMLVGELITGLYAVESRMVLQVGEVTGFIDHSRRVELAFTDAAGRTVTIPQGMLTPGNTITTPELPVDVRVLEFFKNTDLRPASGGDDLDGVVRFDGARFKVVPAGESAGVKSEREDAAGVKVAFLKKGTDEVLAERFLTLWQYENYTGRQYLGILPTVTGADGKASAALLRNERIAKPYTVELLNFEHKQYAGTSTAKDFASTVRLLDPETGDDRQVRVWMNHPLRHRGETFYQHQTIFGDTGTVLQVVRNPAWLLPYVSCIVVTLGMLVHFGVNLSKFTSRRAAA